MAMAMASTARGLLLQLHQHHHHHPHCHHHRRHHRQPSATLSRTSSTATSSPHSTSTCILPTSNWCTRATTSFVSAELRTTGAVGRFGTLCAAGSEVAASVPVEEKDGPNLPCDTCNSKGWLVCDFCKGQKTNVQVRANKFYRRCPSCRAVGVVICPQCKVFKCVTFPDGVDGY